MDVVGASDPDGSCADAIAQLTDDRDIDRIINLAAALIREAVRSGNIDIVTDADECQGIATP